MDEEAIAKLEEDRVLSLLNASWNTDKDISIHDIIKRSSYLDEYPTWQQFYGVENTKDFSKKAITRQDNIWEWMTIARTYMQMLIMMRDVYLAEFPSFEPGQYESLPAGLSSSELKETLFPRLHDLIFLHENLLRLLLAVHNMNKNKQVDLLGCCLVSLFGEAFCRQMAKIYGGFMFAQKRVRDQLQRCRQCPQIAEFLNNCQRDSRTGRRSPEDCHMVIIQHWTKVESLLNVIIKNTLNKRRDVILLESARDSVQSILKNAETFMAEKEYTETLRLLVSNLSLTGADVDDLRKELTSPSTTITNYGPLRLLSNTPGQPGSPAPGVDVIGVALNNCFFLIRKLDDTRYVLYRDKRLPPVLWWMQEDALFRKHPAKLGYGFFIIINTGKLNEGLPSFECSTEADLVRWETVLEDGFKRWCATIALDPLVQEVDAKISEAEEQLTNTNHYLELVRNLDSGYLRALNMRTFLYTTLLNEQLKELQVSSNSSSKATYPADSVSSKVQLSETLLDNFSSTETFDRFSVAYQDILSGLMSQIGGSCRRNVSRSSSHPDGAAHHADIQIKKRDTIHSLDGDNDEQKFKKKDSVLHFMPRPARPTSINISNSRSQQQSATSESPSSPNSGLLPNADFYSLLKELNEYSAELLSFTRNLQTELLHVQCELKNLNSISEAVNKFRHNTNGLVFLTPGDDDVQVFNIKQETEKLRQDQLAFLRKSEQWNKEYREQRDAIERDNGTLAKERAELERREQKHNEDRITLQKQIELYSQQGMSSPSIALPEYQWTPSKPTRHRREPSNNSRNENYRQQRPTLTQSPKPAAQLPSNRASEHLLGSYVNRAESNRKSTNADPPKEALPSNQSTGSSSSLLSLAKSSKTKKK